MIAADAEADFREYEQVLGRPLAEDEMEPRNAAYRTWGSSLTAADYLAARQWIHRWARRMADWWETYDVLVTPTLAAPPPPLGWFTSDPALEGRRIASFSPYTAAFNMTGQPAVSLPLHWTAGGLPVGVQFVARYGREDVLVRLASQLETAAPWSLRRPAIAA
jgi:amidase